MLRLVLAASILSGCGLYLGDDTPDPPPCAYGVGAADAIAYEVRDPYTGQCYPTGGGYPCDDACGPCAYDDIAEPAYGAQCYGMCYGLDENSCLANPGCHAAYDMDARADGGSWFNECWDIAPLPVQQGSCEGLDAWTCSQHDDCTSQFDVFYGPDDGVQSRNFISCAGERSNSCEATTCAPGTHCEEQCTGACPPCDPTVGGMGCTCETTCYPACVPDEPYSCDAIDCGPGYQCVEQCDPSGGGLEDGYCYPTCVVIPNEPGECYGDVRCTRMPPACPSGTTPGVLNGCYTDYCIPVSQCGPQDPGTCDAATCAQPAPACPAGSTAGVKNGCYTGYCIPDSSCPQLACEEITSESTCTSRMDCTPVYTGSDCTCLPDGTCTCTSTEFSRCETWWL